MYEIYFTKVKAMVISLNKLAPAYQIFKSFINAKEFKILTAQI